MSALNATPSTPILASFDREVAAVERLADQGHDMSRHGEIDVGGRLDEPIDEVELASPPGQVVRVDRDAVSAHTRAGRELHEPERLGGSGPDHLPHVEVHPLAQQRQLVDERDIDVAEDVLEELGHLGGIG